jgi:hypothetical protein
MDSCDTSVGFQIIIQLTRAITTLDPKNGDIKLWTQPRVTTANGQTW